MNEHKDGFVPQTLLEKLAKEGHEEAKQTLIKMEEIKEKKREMTSTAENMITPEQNSRKANREVYDSQNTSQQKYKLVRKEEYPPVSDENVNFAYDYGGKTRDYYLSKLNRNSIDDKGMDLIFNVHFSERMNNAYWDGSQMQFGDGDGELFTNFTKGSDVIAHELSHGVTQYLNGLEYFGQSGALNEHFSDAIGSAVKQFIKGQTAETADWLIGNEIVGPKFPGKALRSMKEPGTANSFDDQPSNMKDYKDLPNDNGGVHTNSGIPNKAFFLVSMGIGTDQATLIWYAAWRNKTLIKKTATFQEAFEAIFKTAQDLSNEGKVTKNAAEVVKNAFREVGIGSLVTV
ncbi:M4 family metallopeptidase [Paenibacillus elgii]|uniref:M4 family metallopeptidase n=1 Tax=Paenibacillus elgii TaxID=189691 RepID=UPI002D7B595A|nr:M4 family metallopeptidase [Paenibacillus elgii]